MTQFHFFSTEASKEQWSKHLWHTLWFQLEDTVLLIGTLLLFDTVLFPKYEAWLLIGSILNFEALLGAPLIKTTQHLLHIPLKVCLLIGSWLFQCLEAWLLIGTCLLIGTREYLPFVIVYSIMLYLYCCPFGKLLMAIDISQFWPKTKSKYF